MCVPLGGRAHRPEPSRPPKAGLQAPSDHLWARQPPGDRDNRRQRQRHHPLRVAGGCRTGHPGAARATQAKAEERLRRSGLSLTEVPARTAPSQGQGQGRQAKRSARLRSRPKALGGRAHHLLASPVPPLAGALRATCRHPPGVPDDRLLPDLPQAASDCRVIVKGVLSKDGYHTTAAPAGVTSHQRRWRQLLQPLPSRPPGRSSGAFRPARRCRARSRRLSGRGRRGGCPTPVRRATGTSSP